MSIFTFETLMMIQMQVYLCKTMNARLNGIMFYCYFYLHKGCEYLFWNCSASDKLTSYYAFLYSQLPKIYNTTGS